MNRDDIPFAWIRDELTLPAKVFRGQHGLWVVRVQEWLVWAGLGLVVDGDFGPVTEYAVRRFQEHAELPVTGVVEQESFIKLTAPLRQAMAPPATRPGSLAEAMVLLARRHLSMRPRELGGHNRGPWVRAYMEGVDGPSRLWGSGFLCLIARQAAWVLDCEPPFEPQHSYDMLALAARAKGTLVTEADLRSGEVSVAELEPGALFLHREAPDDWTQAGIVTEFGDEVIETIEGNSDSGGSREGSEVARRLHCYWSKDFVLVG